MKERTRTQRDTSAIPGVRSRVNSSDAASIAPISSDEVAAMTLTPTMLREYDREAPAPDETETATFALGCFWGPEAQFGALEGVVRTRVGYAGGTKRNPTYHALGDHTEVFQVDFDPEESSFADLLDRVFQNHNPRHQSRNTQYQNIVFAATPGQREVLDEFLAAEEYSDTAIETRIEQLGEFSLAEAYHQKHSLQSRPGLADAFEAADYDNADLRESPAATKLNGHAGGHDLPDDDDLATIVGRTGQGR
jgi:peptide-methionine (S)-S-oxide reductase